MTGGDGAPGAVLLAGGGCRFRVWAPKARAVQVHLLSPAERVIPLEPRERGYHEADVPDVGAGVRYRYVLDGGLEYPDPASRLQPDGVHGPSEVADPAFTWTDADWRGLTLADHIIYELHVGTFSEEGTFDGVIGQLDALVDLGVTAVELMPVAHFPGTRNWGYDGVYLYAVHTAYGGPDGLKRLVDACHRRGIAVILDVVYNHLGPEGNYLGAFGPYFTSRYHTLWGDAVNFDGPDSDEVRRFVLDNACRWTEEFHIDGLRLDAVHAIFDGSARHILEELGAAVHESGRALGRRVCVIAESNLNDPRLTRPVHRGGYGLDAVWSDDFHHALHTLLTGERLRYYEDFGGVGDLALAWTEGFVVSGRYSPFRRRYHGAPSRDVPAPRFVVCAQNHDQVGNRALGERLSDLVGFEALKLAAGVVLLAPFVPLLFMGEEYGEIAPFLYFTDHGDPELGEAVRRGRRAEYRESEPPDPQSPETFERSRLRRALAHQPRHRALLEFYATLIRLRKTVPALANLSKEPMEVLAVGQSAPVEGDGAPGDDARVMVARRWRRDSAAVAAFNFSPSRTAVEIPLPAGRWTLLLDSADATWAGPGRAASEQIESGGTVRLTLAPWSFVLFGSTAG
ncbi:MAG TPA: malto-oligosyltrehalose trehalohydrolase [bacterium]|nr:malto-oligosyltrehalose trehalohydrolase [bacterium]